MSMTWAAVALAGTMLVLSACSSSSKTDTSGGTTPTTAEAIPTATIPAATKDAALAAMVPSKLTTAGKAVVATDASYAPNEFFKPGSTTDIIGMDIDLGHAIGQVLGVPFEFTNAGFDTIIPAMGSRYDVSMSSFTDNLERQKTVDMVTYFVAGESFMVKKGQNQDLSTLDALCGHTVGVEKGTVELDDATAQSKTCKTDGKKAVTISAFPDESGANLALSSGRVDVVFADTPVVEYAATQSGGAFEVIGDPLNSAPYGIVVPKTSDYSGLSNAILGAMKNLNESGLYQKILAKWGVQAGAITDFKINGATS
jgi:polar amino acid transport system substrate-binding protein